MPLVSQKPVDRMEYADALIIESNERYVRINLKRELTLGEIYNLMFQLTGYRGNVSLSIGIARINFENVV